MIFSTEKSSRYLISRNTAKENLEICEVVVLMGSSLYRIRNTEQLLK